MREGTSTGKVVPVAAQMASYLARPHCAGEDVIAGVVLPVGPAGGQAHRMVGRSNPEGLVDVTSRCQFRAAADVDSGELRERRICARCQGRAGPFLVAAMLVKVLKSKRNRSNRAGTVLAVGCGSLPGGDQVVAVC